MTPNSRWLIVGLPVVILLLLIFWMAREPEPAPVAAPTPVAIAPTQPAAAPTQPVAAPDTPAVATPQDVPAAAAPDAAQAPEATVTNTVGPSPTPIDAVAECGAYVTNELTHKANDTSPLHPDLQSSLRTRLEKVPVCRAFVSNDDSACTELPNGEQQGRCKSALADVRKAWQGHGGKVGRAQFASMLGTMCKQSLSEKECTAVENAVRSGDEKLCAGVTSGPLQKKCAAFASGDAGRCDPSDTECPGTAQMIGGLAKQQGVADLPDDARGQPEDRILMQIVMGRSTGGCDAVVEAIRTDCIQKVGAGWSLIPSTPTSPPEGTLPPGALTPAVPVNP